MKGCARALWLAGPPPPLWGRPCSSEWQCHSDCDLPEAMPAATTVSASMCTQKDAEDDDVDTEDQAREPSCHTHAPLQPTGRIQSTLSCISTAR